MRTLSSDSVRLGPGANRGCSLRRAGFLIKGGLIFAATAVGCVLGCETVPVHSPALIGNFALCADHDCTCLEVANDGRYWEWMEGNPEGPTGFGLVKGTWTAINEQCIKLSPGPTRHRRVLPSEWCLENGTHVLMISTGAATFIHATPELTGCGREGRIESDRK
jgi:hypothetical protein